jgi:hypothetical protein
MSAAADAPAYRIKRKYEADHKDDDHQQHRDFGHEAGDQENEAEDDHAGLLFVCAALRFLSVTPRWNVWMLRPAGPGSGYEDAGVAGSAITSFR